MTSIENKEVEVELHKSPLCPLCPLCLCEPFLPTTLNILIKNENDIITIKKCLATSKNPMCLPCIRDFVNSQEGENLVCPYKCCIGFKAHKLYQTYGDYLRGTNEFPEMCMWTTLYNYGVLNTKCNLCEYKCNTLEETLNHLRKNCIKRKLSCNECKILVSFNEIDIHKLDCKLESFTFINL